MILTVADGVEVVADEVGLTGLAVADGLMVADGVDVGLTAPNVGEINITLNDGCGGTGAIIWDPFMKKAITAIVATINKTIPIKTTYPVFLVLRVLKLVSISNKELTVSLL